MPHPLEELRKAALHEIESASDAQSLEAARVKYLGRSGSISAWGERLLDSLHGLFGDKNLL